MTDDKKAAAPLPPPPPPHEMTPCWSQDGVSVTRHAKSGIFVLHMHRQEQNLFNPTLVHLLSQALKVVEQAAHPKALIITGQGKFFSNGLDLAYLRQQQQCPQGHGALVEMVWRWLARLLVLDCRTVAAINGHAFGAGWFVALACDYRLLRTQRGYVCWPEVNLGMRLAKGFAELTKAKVSNATVWRDGVLTGQRYNAATALQAGLIDAACPIKELMTQAWALAKAPQKFQNFNSHSFAQMKMELYTDAYRALTMAKADDAPHSRL